MTVNFSQPPALITPITSRIDKFSKVDNNFYRGSMPSADDLMDLKRQGIDYVINYKGGHNADEKAIIAAEKAFVEKLGMKFVSIPIDSRRGPQKEQIDKFYKVVDEILTNDKKAYEHCKHGRDRTGVMTALYELKKGAKSYHQIIKEFFSFGYNQPKHPHLLEIIKKHALRNKCLFI